MSASTFPTTQAWTVEGLRVHVRYYKRSFSSGCVVCGARGCHHSVSVDSKLRRGENFDDFQRRRWSGHGGYCDEHRPPKGTLPADLVVDRYLAAIRDGNKRLVITEHHEQTRFEVCDGHEECYEMAVGEFSVWCEDCPEHTRPYRDTVISIEGAEQITGVRHHDHELSHGFRCAAHMPSAVRANPQ